MKIKNKLLSLYASIAIIPLILMSLFVLSFYRNSLTEKSNEQMDNIMNQSVSYIDQLIDFSVSDLESLYGSVYLKNYVTSSEYTKLAFENSVYQTLQEFINHHSIYCKVDVVDHAGKNLIAVTNSKYNCDVQLKKINQNKKVVRIIDGKAYLILNKSLQYYTPISDPLKKPIKHYASLVLYIPLNNIYKLWESVDFSKTGNVYLIDSDFKVVSHSMVGLLGNKVKVKEKGLLRKIKFTRSSLIGVVVEESYKDIYSDISKLKYYIYGIGFFMCIIAILAIYYTAKSFAYPLVKLSNETKEIAKGYLNRELDSVDDRRDEVGDLYRNFDKMRIQLLDQHSIIKNISADEARGKVASQVAHDIKSPLSVLVSISEYAKDMKENDRILLRMAVQSIGDIANDLSLQSSKKESVDDLVRTEVSLMSALIEGLVSEKRIEYRSMESLTIASTINRNTYALFISVNPTTFKRVFSNLINNSIESFEGNGGDVQVQIEAFEGGAQVTVKDNGKGIPSDKLDSIFERGKSFGKERKENSGLGLCHAKESVESWGGTITVESEVGVGTEFTITLPLAKQPDWFLGRIILKQDKQFVIIDDDQSIHEIWKNRLGEAGASVQQMQHFSSADSFEKWIHATDKSDRYLFLFDYELLGSKKTGLDLIEEFQLQDQAVLVTSRYEEPSIRERCQKIGLKLLPKSLAGYVPIVKEASYVVPKQRVDCVFVDDNDLVRMNWERKAAEVGINILTFGNTTDFYAKLHLCDQDTVFFIDQHLNDGTYGLDTAKNLKQKGFHKIYMASGFDADELGVPKGIVKGCVGKKPPFDDLTVFNRAKQSEDDDER